MSATVHQFPPMTLSAPGRPTLLVAERAALDCGCCIWLGRRVDNGAVAASAEPCSAEHRPLAARAYELLEASTANPQKRPLADVAAELLDQAQSERVPTACNERPPAGHPFHGTGVACHLAAGHVELGEAHSWDIDAALARHQILSAAIAKLRDQFPGRPIERVDSQLPHPIAVYDVQDGVRAKRPYRIWDTTAGPWVLVTFAGGDEYAIWKPTGAVYRVGPDGAVDEDPVLTID